MRHIGITLDATAPKEQAPLQIYCSRAIGCFYSYYSAVIESLNKHWWICALKSFTNAKLEISIASCSENFAIWRKEKRVTITSTKLGDINAIECCNFKRHSRLSALQRVEPTLTMAVAATANHIMVARQEQRVWATAAERCDFILKHVEGIDSEGLACSDYMW